VNAPLLEQHRAPVPTLGAQTHMQPQQPQQRSTVVPTAPLALPSAFEPPSSSFSSSSSLAVQWSSPRETDGLLGGVGGAERIRSFDQSLEEVADVDRSLERSMEASMTSNEASTEISAVTDQPSEGGSDGAALDGDGERYPTDFSGFISDLSGSLANVRATRGAGERGSLRARASVARIGCGFAFAGPTSLLISPLLKFTTAP